MEKYIKKKNKGFTLLELLMVIAIFSILTSVIVFNYGDFNHNIIATNMAYEVALTVREAQVYSLGARGENNDFDNRYGAYFNTNSSDENFMLFSDVDGGDIGVCDDGDGNSCGLDMCTNDECQQLSSLTRGIKIVDLCVRSSGDFIDSSGNCVGDSVDELSISFERPNPDALISSDPITSGAYAAVILEAPNGTRRVIKVISTGQISVETYAN